MSEWEERPLGKVVKLRRGHDLPARVRRPGSVPVISSGATEGWHDTAIADGPGVVIGRATNIGRPKWVSGPYWPHNTTLYVEDFFGQEPRWVFHLFETLDLTGFNSGSVQPMLNRNFIANLQVLVPPEDEQRRITAVLGAFDDLIEANRVLADHMHDAARAVGLTMLDRYSERGDMPLKDVAAISRGFSYKTAELVPGADTLVNLKNFGRGGVFNHDGFKPLTSDRFKPSQVVQPGDVAVSMTDLTQQRGVIARPIRIPRVNVEGKMVVSLDLAIARPLNGHDREFVAAVLSQEAFHSFARNYCNGTTVLHMSVKAFDDYTVPRISPDEAAPFVDRIRALNEAEDSIRDEITDLTRTRDELLPLLMSGSVRVEDQEVVA